MSALPNPFEFAASTSLAAEPAAVSLASAMGETAAEVFDRSSSNLGRLQEAPAAATPTAVAGLLAEIELHHRFQLDEVAFMEAMEEPPMFLQAAQ